MKGREVVVGRRTVKPDFSAFTPGKAMFGLVGAMAMYSSGNDIVAQFQINDPAEYIGQRMSADLAKQTGVRPIAARALLPDSDDVAELVKANPKADLLVDVRTLSWSFNYFATSWGKYRVIYNARMRLIDAKKQSVIAEAGCSRVPDDLSTAPTYDELLANGAARLKKELRIAADECADKFRTEALAP